MPIFTQMAQIDHTELLVVITILAGLAGLIIGNRPGRPQRSKEVQRVNRRALVILPIAAVGLAVLVQLVADHGFVPLFTILAYGSFYASCAVGMWVAGNRQRLLAGTGRLAARLVRGGAAALACDRGPRR